MTSTRHAISLLAAAATCAFAGDVAGPILTDTVWTPAESPYVITDDVTIAGGATLTIQPGVTVRFTPDTNLTIGDPNLGAGELIANGNEATPILFTSNADAPAPGDWGAVRFVNQAVDAIVESGAYVSGSTLQHCIIEFAGGDDGPGCVLTEQASIYVAQCLIRDGAQCGLVCTGSLNTLHLIDTTFERCTALIDPKTGGGLHIFKGVDHVVVGCTFIDNLAERGGGAFLYHDSTFADLGELTFINNTALLYGGGLSMGRHDLHDSHFESNYADFSGGGLYEPFGSSSVTGCTFIANKARQDGAGAFLESELVHDCWFELNATQIGDGGGLMLDPNTNDDASVTDCTFLQNYAYRGGGAWIDRSFWTIDSVSFIENVAFSDGGALYMIQCDEPHFTNVQAVGNYSYDSGGAFAFRDVDDALIEDCALIDNEAARDGGALWLDFNSQFCDIKSSLLADNNAGRHGGAVFVGTNSYGGDYSGNDDVHNTITGNQADSLGDAIYFGPNNNHVLPADKICWGVNDINVVSAMIHDHDDDATFGYVEIDPIIFCEIIPKQCIADCDQNEALNILDFVCFQQKFQSADPGADCDDNGILSILDFICFQQAFQEGCPQ